MDGHHGNQPSDLCLDKLTERLFPDDYRRLGLRLGLESVCLDRIERERCRKVTDCFYHMLVEWKKRQGHNATSQCIIQTLEEIGNQTAADWLQAECASVVSASSHFNLETILDKGNIPSLPDCLTDRPEELADFREKIRAFSSATSPPSTRWLVVHGMGGMGKSVLVNQGVRDEQLINECFPNGVFWLAIGAAVKDKVEVTERLETLCRTLDDSLLMAPSPPKTEEQWKNHLRKLITEQRPRCLIILDDVWNSEVIRAFDVRCTVVITTRNAGIHTCVTGRKDEVVLSDGFSESQSMEALSNWTQTSLSELPPEARRIHRLSRGSPLVICLIGGLLRNVGQRWEFYVHQLEEKHHMEMSTVRDAIHLSIQEMPRTDVIMSLFSWLSVFEKGTLLSAKILGMLEGCRVEDVEDAMHVLTQRHLSISHLQSDDNCHAYMLHDLVHDYLVSEKLHETKDSRVCNEFKALTIFNRFRTCRANMIQTSLYLPQPSEVFRRARRVAQLAKDQFFVAEIGDRRPAVYSVTHRPAGKYATCARLLPNGRELVTAGYGGVIQIANFVDGDSRTLIQGHAENITDLSVSSDGSLLATCSPDGGVCVWDFSATDRPLNRVKNLTHEVSAVTRCSFIRADGELILVSADNKGHVKIWKIKSTSFTLLRSMSAHNTSITSCSTCDEERAFLTCAEQDNSVRSFSVQSGGEKFHIDHSDELRDCSYLGNGLIVTLTMFQLQVFTSRGRRLCRWTEGDSSVYFGNVSCAEGSDGHYIAVRGRAMIITVLKVGHLFQVTKKLSVYYRLNVGGIYRDVINMWMASNGKGANYLITNQSCGLILVWDLDKEHSRPRIDGSVYDVCFQMDGGVAGVVGTRPNKPRECLMVHPCTQKSLCNSSKLVYKTKEKREAVEAVKILPDCEGKVMSCTSTRIKVSTLPLCGGKRSLGNGFQRRSKQEFSVHPAENIVLLARLIGDRKHHLLTVSSGAGILSMEIWCTESSTPVSGHLPHVIGLSADLSPDQKMIAVGCSTGTVMMFGLSDHTLTEDKPATLDVNFSRITCCVFSSSSQLLAVAGERQLTMIDPRTMTSLAESCEKIAISRVGFSPDNRLLLIVAGSVLSLRDSRTLEVRYRSAAYAEVTDFTFSPNGNMLVTAGAVKYFDKGYVEWWRIDPSGVICQLQKFMINSRVKRVVCNQYFTVFVTVDEVGEIYVLQRITADIRT